jgi:hypothetical protein
LPDTLCIKRVTDAKVPKPLIQAPAAASATTQHRTGLGIILSDTVNATKEELARCLPDG